jgi:hypothetical protein
MATKKASGASLTEQIEVFTSPAGANLYMTPDSKVFASEEAAVAHIAEHAHEIEADSFIEHVRENAEHYFAPSIGSRGLSVQLTRMKGVIVGYLGWKAGGPLPPVKVEKRKSKTATEENPLG